MYVCLRRAKQTGVRWVGNKPLECGNINEAGLSILGLVCGNDTKSEGKSSKKFSVWKREWREAARSPHTWPTPSDAKGKNQ